MDLPNHLVDCCCNLIDTCEVAFIFHLHHPASPRAAQRSLVGESWYRERQNLVKTTTGSPYLQTERVEDQCINGGDVEVKRRQMEEVKSHHHLQQLLGPPLCEDLEVGMALHHGHLYVCYRRLLLRRSFIGVPRRVLREGEEIGKESGTGSLLDSLASFERLD